MPGQPRAAAKSRRDKLAITQCLGIGNAIRRTNQVLAGRLKWRQVPLTGGGISRPFGTKCLATGALPTLKCWAILVCSSGTLDSAGRSRERYAPTDVGGCDALED